MTQAPGAVFKIPTESSQRAPGKAPKPSGRARKVPHTGRGPVLASGNGRAATRGGGKVIELECGITVYPARCEGAAGGRSGTKTASGSRDVVREIRR
jgi:hypothetical protein